MPQEQSPKPSMIAAPVMITKPVEQQQAVATVEPEAKAAPVLSH